MTVFVDDGYSNYDIHKGLKEMNIADFMIFINLVSGIGILCLFHNQLKDFVKKQVAKGERIEFYIAVHIFVLLTGAKLAAVFTLVYLVSVGIQGIRALGRKLTSINLDDEQGTDKEADVKTTIINP